MSEPGDKRSQLENQLHSINQRFERELRARGFDPAQADTSALPSPLDRLYIERQTLLEELEELNMASAKEQRNTNEVERIRDQFRRAFDGEAWHGPSVLSLLSGVTAEQAAAHPIPGAHSIWELVLHIAAWETACRRRLEGERAQLSDEEDWQQVTDTSEAAWERTRKELVDSHNLLLESLASLDESKLDQPIINDPTTTYSSVYVTLHGGVQHDLYHAGQIAMLKKAIEGVAP
jgi:uncharacterized damage-inducible protein DinB